MSVGLMPGLRYSSAWGAAHQEEVTGRQARMHTQEDAVCPCMYAGDVPNTKLPFP